MEEETKKQIWIFAFMLIVGVCVILLLAVINHKDTNVTINGNEEKIVSESYMNRQLSWNNVTLTDRTNYDKSSNLCTASYLGMSVNITPCVASTITGKDITQKVDFAWNGAISRNITAIFVYTGQLEDASLQLNKNVSYDYNTIEYVTTPVNNYLVDNVVSYTDMGSPDSRCSVGNVVNNTKMYYVTREGTLGSSYYCFNTVTPINATAFRISGYYDKGVFVKQTGYRYEYVDVSNSVEDITSQVPVQMRNGFTYYKVTNVNFDVGEIKETQWVYTPKNAMKTGKWHILMYDTSEGLIDAIQNDHYLYIDPWWNVTWIYRKLVSNLSTNQTFTIINVTYDSDMAPDFSDLRFTDNASTPTLLLPFWIENYNRSTSAVIRVKSYKNASIYMHYANRSSMSGTMGSNITNLYGNSLQMYLPMERNTSATIAGQNITDVVNNIVFSNKTSEIVNYSHITPVGKGINKTNNAFVNVSAKTISLTSGFTWQAWVYKTSTHARGIFANRNGAANNNYQLYVDASGRPEAFIWSGGTNRGTNSGVVLAAGIFHHIIITWNGTDLRFYQDGVNVANSTRGAYVLDNNDAQISIGSDGNLDYWLNIVDEIGIWDTPISAQEAFDLYYQGSSEAIAVFGAEENAENLAVTLDYPPAVLTNTTAFFNWTLTPTQVEIRNYTLYVWNADGSVNFTNYTAERSNSTIIRNYTTTLTGTGYYTWNVYGCYRGNLTGVQTCSFGTNETFLLDLSAPVVNITFPSNKYIYDGIKNLEFNWTVVDGSLDTCIFRNATGVNNTVTCNSNTTVFNFTNFGRDADLVFFANDTTGNLAEVHINVTSINVSGSYQNYGTDVLENSPEHFVILINKSNNVTAYPTLYYNTTAVTNYTESSNGYFNITYNIPEITNTFNDTFNFYWNWTMSFANGTNQSFTSIADNKTQIVHALSMAQCGGNYTQKFLNITFKDENSLAQINATIDASTFTYSQTGFANQTLIYSNSSHYREYDFCIYPAFVNNVNLYGVVYASASDVATYPQRKYNFNTTLMNTTLTNITILLLKSTEGVTSSYQVVSIGNQVISGAYIELERTISGTVYPITSGYTDSSGIMTAFLNPNYQHTLRVSASGYSSQTHSIYPTQSIYTITMGTSNAYFNYSAPIEGMTWTKWPPYGIITEGVYNFSFNVNTRTNLIYNCSFNIRYPNMTIIGSALGCNTSVPNKGGIIYIAVNITKLADLNLTRVYGDYWIDTASSHILIENDANWKIYAVDYNNYYGSLKNLMNDTYDMPEWGDNPSTRDFNRIVFFFIFLAVALAVMNYYTGYDTAYPGAFIYLMTGFVFLASAMGGVTGPGFFYLEGALSPNMFGSSVAAENVSKIFNNWILFFHFFLLSIIYFFTTQKRYQTG